MEDLFNDLSALEERLGVSPEKNQRSEDDGIARAYAFTKGAHGNQKRDEGTAYVIHPLRVALILRDDIGISKEPMLMAALLHDVVEDTPKGIQEIRDLFGDAVSDLVQALTRVRLYPESEHDKFARKGTMYDWYIHEAPEEVRLIKCADILDNMRSWAYIPEGHSSEKKFKRWIREAEVYYLPLAELTHPFFAREISALLNRYRQERRFQI